MHVLFCFVLQSQVVSPSPLSLILIRAIFLAHQNIFLVLCQRIRWLCLFASQGNYEYQSARGCGTGCENMGHYGSLMSAHDNDVIWWKSARQFVLWAHETPSKATGFVCICQVNHNSGQLHNEFSPSLVFFCQPGKMLNKRETRSGHPNRKWRQGFVL